MRGRERVMQVKRIFTHHPNVFCDEKDFCTIREEGHSAGCGFLLLVLHGDPRSVLVHLCHACEGF